MQKSFISAKLNWIHKLRSNQPQLGTKNIFDDDEDRHDDTKPTYDQDNPPPTKVPSSYPSKSPSQSPSLKPSASPSLKPSNYPSISPSSFPSMTPSTFPSLLPTETPSLSPSLTPSTSPSLIPSRSPSISPSSEPSGSPSFVPSKWPSSSPSFQPSSSPSIEPSLSPSLTPSPSPSTTPSSSPSTMPSKYICKLSGDGNFGNTTGVNIEREIMAFSYDAILNMTLLDATSGTDEEKVEQAVVPSIESQLSDLLLPSIFPQCNDAVSNSTSSLSRVKGMSSQPKDRVSERKCITQDSSGGDCFPIDGGLSLYYESSGRRYLLRELVEDTGIQSTIDFIEESIKTVMDKGDMNNAHPAIIRISYVETNNNPIVPPIEKSNNGDLGGTNIVWWQIGLGIGVAGLLIG